MNARTIFLSFVLILVASAAYAQPEIEWERTYGGRDDDYCLKVLQTLDRGFVLAVNSEQRGIGYSDIGMLRLDSECDSLWFRSYYEEQSSRIGSMIQVSDGSFVFASSLHIFRTGDVDYWLVKVDSQGEPTISKTYGGSELDTPKDIVQTEDGGYALAGISRSFGDLNGDFWLVRTNIEGDSLWSKSYGGTNYDYCNALIQTTDGGFALSGFTQSYGSGAFDFWLVRTDSLGDSLWSRTYGGRGHEECNDIIQTDDGGFIMVGYTTSFGMGSYDYWILKTDAEGDSLWSKTFGGVQRDYCTTLISTKDGGFLLGGATFSFGEGENDAWIVRTSRHGDSLWSCTFGGNDYDCCFSLIQSESGNFLVAGSTRSFGAGREDIYLVKTTPDPASVRKSQVIAPFTLHLAQPYPNPFNSTVTIPFSLSAQSAKSAVQLTIFDPLGKRITDLLPNSTGDLNRRYGSRGSVVWNANGFPAGSYIIRLEAGSQSTSQQVQLIK